MLPFLNGYYLLFIYSSTNSKAPSRKPTLTPSKTPSYLTTKAPSFRPSLAPTVTLTNNPTFSKDLIMLVNITWSIQGVQSDSSLQKHYLPALSRLFRTTTCQSLNITFDHCYCNYKTYGFRLGPTPTIIQLDSHVLSSPVPPYALHSIDSQHLKLRKDYTTAQDTPEFSHTPTTEIERNSFLSTTSDYSNELKVVVHIPIPLTNFVATDAESILSQCMVMIYTFINNFAEDISQPFKFLSTLESIDPIDFVKNITTIDEIDFSYSFVNEFLETNPDDTRDNNSSADDDYGNNSGNTNSDNAEATKHFAILFPVLLGVFFMISIFCYFHYKRVEQQRMLKERNNLHSFHKLQDGDDASAPQMEMSHIQVAQAEAIIMEEERVTNVPLVVLQSKYSKLV